MLEKMWASLGVGGVSFTVSLAFATGVLQFLTALIGLASASIGFWLLLKKLRSDPK